MATRKTLHLTSRKRWRAWLARHHRSETEVWLVFHKKHTGQPRIAYAEAVEEAICFGWIDSLVKRLDAEKYAQKFTPRRIGSRWSPLNRTRLRKLVREGRMTKAGLAKVDSAALRDKPDAPIPRAVQQALKEHPKAWKQLQSLTPSRRSAYLRLIMEAKTEETRARRVRQAVELLEQSTGEPNAIPGFFAKALKANPKAGENFRSLAPSHRRHYIGWLVLAKQEATRERRLREAIRLLEQNQKLGLK